MAAIAKAVKRGKENAAPRKVVEEVEVDDSFDTLGDNKKRAGRDGEPSLATAIAERDRARKERDAYARQFEELSKLRNTDVEALFARFKERASEQAATQTKIIADLEALNAKLAARARALEKDVAAATARADKAAKALPLDASLEGKTGAALREEVGKLRLALKGKEGELARVQKEYDAEVKQHQALQKSKSGSGSGAGAAPAPAAAAGSGQTADEAEKDAESLKLYEDLSGLAVLGVEVRDGKAGRETVFTCCQTSDGKSLAFKLRYFKEPNRTTKQWERMVQYTPNARALQHERARDRALVDRLGPFTGEFVAPRDQVAALAEQMRARLAGTAPVDDVPDA
ncbi:hypothetical protein Q5752_003922 [Cryptotrichosporon argae]